MPLDAAAIERIVQGVLSQIGAPGTMRAAEDDSQTSASEPRKTRNERNDERSVSIADRIVTAALVEDRAEGASVIEVAAGAIITPAARDVIRDRGLTVRTAPEPRPAASSQPARNSIPETSATLHAYIVRHTAVLDRVLDDVAAGAHRELLGCPDDAAALAIGAVCRGETAQVVIFAEQTHRAACLANRNDRVKAAAVAAAADVRAVKKQLRANVWCVDPTGRSWMELRNLIRALDP